MSDVGPDSPSSMPTAVGQVVAALAGIAVGGPGGAVLGAVAADPMVRIASKAWREIQGRRELNVGRLLESAAADLDAAPEAMVAEALSSRQGSRLLHEALQAAAATLEEEKIEALAKSLANGLDDVAEIDREVLMIRALSDLDPVHVRTLVFVDQHQSVELSDITPTLMGEPPSDLLEVFDRVDITAPIVAVLERHGLIVGRDEERPGRLGSTGGVRNYKSTTITLYRSTAFGRACLVRLGHELATHVG